MAPKGIRLLRFRPVKKTSLRDFADVEVPIGLVIREIPVLASQGKFWASLPSKPVLGPDCKHALANRRKQYALTAGRKSRELSDASAKLVALVRVLYPDALEGPQ
jgi:hypothetical protein